MQKQFLLYNDPSELDFTKLPFPKDWCMNALYDKTDQIHGYLKSISRDANTGKILQVEGGENQVMHWFKHSLAMMSTGVIFSTIGEHKGYADNTETEVDETSMPSGWKYLEVASEKIYSTHAWNDAAQGIAIEGTGTALATDTQLYPLFPTKMRFGSGLPPGGVSEPVAPDDTELNDTDAQGPGNTPGKLNFIFIDREIHLSLSSTGFNPTSPSGYYLDYGAPFKNITIFEISMPGNATSYSYDGETLNEAGLFCDAGLSGTSNDHDMPEGMILCKRYFNDVLKTNTINISFQWSVVF